MTHNLFFTMLSAFPNALGSGKSSIAFWKAARAPPGAPGPHSPYERNNNVLML
ncbi:hypothetical protein B0I27_10675 [Arcticibacter pallidicorallinus]|uniref:Uncharacterized protein n=1 Tax=Arcticibacter pallidicorallinus TaxID=1259464 RepID=A0A2T0U329_9SPHI|nr:hypothetical protein B0I27_10675 [Arcticibacter pallidicorallinus]